MLNNNTMFTDLKNAFAQSTGADVSAVIDLQGIIDLANDPNITLEKDQFTKELTSVIIKNMYTDTAYTGKTSELYYVDAEKFGAITRVISVDLPEVRENPAWTNLVSGTTIIGSNTIYLPVVNELLYGKTDSWSIPIALSDEQANTAFNSASELSSFYSYIKLAVTNSITKHREVMSALNRNNFMAEKIAYAESDDATGVHVVNPIKEYCDLTGTDGMTVAEFRKNPACLRFLNSRLNLYKSYMEEISTLFNTEGKEKFAPKNRIACEILSAIETDMEAVSYNSDSINALKFDVDHVSVASWQAVKTSTTALDFDTVSSINVDIASDGTAINKSGIVAFMCDKWALMHTIVSNRVGVQRDDIKAVTLYSHQFVDRYMNNLTLPAIVFMLTDVPASEVNA